MKGRLTAFLSKTRAFFICLLVIMIAAIPVLANTQAAYAAMAAPTGLTATAVSATQVNLAWTNTSTGHTGYSMQRATDTAFTLNLLTVALPSTAVSYSDLTVLPNTIYYYRVYAMTGTTPGPFSNTATVTTPILAAPAAPLTITATVVGPNQINIAWTIPAGNNQTGFTLQRATDAAFTVGLITNLLPGTQLSFIDTKVSPATSYWYQVTATNLGGASLPTALLAAVTTPPLVAPGAPTNLTATVIAGTTNIRLTWTRANVVGGLELGFNIFGDTVNTFNSANTQVYSVPAGTTSFIDTNAPPGAAAYYYRMYAFNLIGSSAFSNVVTVTNIPTGASVPSAPINLTATVISGTQINLSWINTAIDDTGYTVQRSTSATFATVTNIARPANTTSGAVMTYNNTGLTANTTYYYRVYCTNAAGNSGASNAVTTRTAAPAAPTGLAAAAVGPTVVSLWWTNPTIPNQSSFTIQRSTDPAFGTITSLAVADPAATSFSDNTATENTTFYYRIVATNGLGSSAPTPTAGVTVTTPAAATGPLPPSSLTATATTGTRVDLAWTNPAGNTQLGFVLMRARDTAFTTDFTSFSLPATPFTFSDTSVVAGITYNYRMYAFNATGTSNFSNLATVTPPVIMPLTPTYLTATVISGTQINLSWTNPPGNTQTLFTIQRALDSGFTTPSAFTSTTTSYNDTSCVAGTVYYYRVMATNVAGSSSPSNVVSAQALAPTAPAQPTGVAWYISLPLAIPLRSDIVWVDNATNETGYRVEIANDAAFTVNFRTVTLAADSTGYSDPTWIPDVLYYVRVFAFNAAGDSLAGAPLTGTSYFGVTPNLLPLAPSGLNAVAVGINQVTLSWTNPTANPQTGFRLYTATDAAFTLNSFVTVLPATPFTYTDNTVYPGDTFYYKITAFNALGESPVSNVASVTIAMPGTGVPPAPTALTATLGAGNVVNLAWTDNATNESGYIVERATDAAFTLNDTMYLLPAGSTTYADETAAPEVTYYYKVMAFSNFGNSLPSNVVNVTTGTIAVAAPTFLTATVSSATQITLAWSDNAINETGYRVERATDAAFTLGLATFNIAVNSTSYVDGPMTAGTLYYYRITATAALPANNSAPSNVASITAGVPAAPTGVTAVATGPTTINLTWTDNSNSEILYKVQRALAAPVGSQFPAAGTTTWTLPPNSTSFSDTTTATLTSYDYRVFASNAAGDSAFSNIFTVMSLDVVPSQPINLAATAISATQVNLAWTNTATNATSVSVQRATDVNFTLNVANFPVAATAVTYSNAGLVANTTYYYRVFAVNASGNSTPSNTATITTPATTPAAVPSQPTGLTATVINSGQVNLAWTNPAGNTQDGFHLTTALDNLFTLSPITITIQGATTTYVDFSVYPGATFYYRVTAFNVRGDSAVSNTATAIIAAATVSAPTAPTGLTATVVGPTQIDLTWIRETSANEVGFLVYRATDTAFTLNLQAFGLAANTLTYSDTSVLPGTAYYYRICAYNVAGASPNSSIITATTTGTVVPTGPTALSANATSATAVVLTWTDNSNNETGFRVEKTQDSAFLTGITSYLVGANIATYTDTAVVATTTYFYRVFAYGASGDSMPSNSAQVTTPVANAPPAPGGLYFVIRTGTQVDLSWLTSANATSYRLDRALDSGFVTGLTSQTFAPSYVTYSDTTVARGNVYYYRVIATNTAGPSGSSPVATVDMRIPAAPTTLTATAASTASINLTWVDASTNEDGFQIDRALDNNFTAGLASFLAAPNVTAFTDNSAASNTTYFYRISAFSTPLGTSAFSNIVSVSTSLAPAAPTGLTANVASATQISVSWANPPGNNQTGFVLMRAQDTLFTVDYASWTLPATPLTFTDATVVGGKTYYYRMYAVNASGSSVFSNVANANTPLGAPAAPTGLTATAVSVTQVDLSWTNPPGNAQTGFILQRATNTNFTANFASWSLPATPFTFSDTTTAGGTTYYYRMWALNTGGSSNFSNTATATTPVAAPLPPTLAATPVSATRVDLSWTTPAGSLQTGFTLIRAIDSAFTLDFSSWTLPATPLTFSDTTVASGVTYYYKMWAYNAVGSSGFSNVVNVTTQVTTPRTPALSATAVSATQVDLSWINPAGNTQTGFILERATNSSFNAGYASWSLPATPFTFSDTTTAGTTTYYYRMWAYNAVGSSYFSNTATVTTPAAAPMKPTGLTATAVSATQVDLSWTNPAGNNQTGFVLQRATDNVFTTNLVGWLLPATPFTYSDTTTVATTTYYYRMWAVNAAGTSNFSNTATVTTPIVGLPGSFPRFAWVMASSDGSESTGAVALSATKPGGSGRGLALVVAPAAPTNLTANPVTSTQIDLAWTNPAGTLTSVTVQRDTTNAFAAPTSFPLPGTASTFGDTGLTPGTTYWYRVFATNEAGNSPYSAPASAQTTASALTAPTGLTATAAGPTLVNLSWTNTAATQTGLILERATDQNFSVGRIQVPLAAAAISYADNTVAASSTYYYRIFATDGVTSSPASNTATATTPAVPTTPPVAPTSLTATAASTTSVNLSWVNPAGNNQTGFTIERDTNNGFTTTPLTSITVPGTVTSYTDTGLTPQTTYYYRVWATNSLGRSATASPVASVSTIVAGAPAVGPTNLTATKVSEYRIDLAWTYTGTGHSGFHVTTATDPAFPTAGSLTITVAASARTYPDTTVYPGATFYYKITAFNASGESVVSNVASVNIPMPPPGAPGAPTGLSASAASSSAINLSWSAGGGATVGTYLLERANDSGFLNGNATFQLPATPTTYQDTGLAASTTYYYRIFAVNGAGASVASNVASATTQAAATSTGTGSGTGDGGGGGGGPMLISVNKTGLTGNTPVLNGAGFAVSPVTLTSEDQKVTVDIPMATKLVDQAGNPLTSFTCAKAPGPPAPPADKAVIAAYDFGPSGAAFTPGITITIKFTAADLPQGADARDLKIAFWDGAGWQIMAASTVDTQAGTVSVLVTHFTVYAVISPKPAPPTTTPTTPATTTPPLTAPTTTAPAPAPASFAISNLVISPKTCTAGSPVDIQVSVTNSGGSSGSYSVVLKLNDAVEATRSITLAAGASDVVSFSVTKPAATYKVEANELTGSFTVNPAPVAPSSTTTPSTPATTETPTISPSSAAGTEIPAASGVSLWAIVGAIIGAAIVALAILLIVRSRRATR